MALWRTDDALLGVAALTHVMTVLLRFLENPHRASILALNRTRSRRRLAAGFIAKWRKLTPNLLLEHRAPLTRYVLLCVSSAP